MTRITLKSENTDVSWTFVITVTETIQAKVKIHTFAISSFSTVKILSRCLRAGEDWTKAQPAETQRNHTVCQLFVNRDLTFSHCLQCFCWVITQTRIWRSCFDHDILIRRDQQKHHQQTSSRGQQTIRHTPACCTKLHSCFHDSLFQTEALPSA